MSDLQLNREELAWCAGFLDGEGHFGSRHFWGNTGYFQRTIYVDAAQNDRELLDRLARTFGGNVRGPITRNGFSHYEWRLGSFEAVQNVIARTWAWLGSVKREQARKALAHYHAWRPQPRRVTS